MFKNTMIFSANTVIYPWAMMVKIEYTSVADSKNQRYTPKLFVFGIKIYWQCLDRIGLVIIQVEQKFSFEIGSSVMAIIIWQRS